MKFKEFEYKRPCIADIRSEFNDFFKKFRAADSFKKQDEIIRQINKLRNEIESMMTLSLIHI